MNLIRRIKQFTLFELLCGLRVTLKKMFVSNITVHFPEEKTPFSTRFRGILALRRYPAPPKSDSTEGDAGDAATKAAPDTLGEERCIGCKLCEAVCPAQAIVIETEARAVDGQRRTTRFDIDMFKCINCGLCAESCPVDSIVTVPYGNYTIEKRGDNILTKQQLLAIGDHYEAKLKKDLDTESEFR